MTMAISVVYSAIYDKSKGNLPILFLFHGRSNAAHALWYLFYDEQPASNQYLYWIYVAVNIVVAVIAHLVIKRSRLNQEVSVEDA